MSAEDFGEGQEDGDVRLPWIYDAIVVDDADPEGLYRVRVKIEGVIAKSAWAFPMGTVGGGHNRRGFFNVPRVGSMVGCYFHQGDPDYPRYFGGYWGSEAENDDGAIESEVGTHARDIPPEDRKHVRTFETERWIMTFDDRETPKNEAGEPVDDPENPANGQDTWRLVHKESGDFIEVDGGRRGMTIQATAGIFIRSEGLIDIDGLVVQIAGRKVLRTGGIIS
jgi:hypothetical protein